ncbi:MAG TPA: DUF92 domain-containing protein [Candidatus Angelobacter sp.]|nr:DUF92 domain-containing protein [Candidatus Angelobacter sp.]
MCTIANSNFASRQATGWDSPAHSTGIKNADWGLIARTSVRRNDLQETRPSKPAEFLALAFAAGTVLVFALLHGAEFPPAGRRFLTALAITAGFAVLAWFAGGVNFSGALAGSAVAFIMAVRDLRMFLALLVVFAVTLVATRAGYARKQQLRTAQAGGRTAAQAMANLGIAALVVAIAPAGWPVLALAALAEAAADTSSSEIGMAFPGKTFLITTFKTVPAGIDGGISLLGTLAALAGAAAVAAAAVLSGLVPTQAAVVIIGAGFFGTVVDSLLGAIFERRGWLDNDLVNLLSTAAATGAAWVVI